MNSRFRPSPALSWMLATMAALCVFTPQVALSQPGSGGALSREERLKQHRERINKILEERRRQEGTAPGAPGADAKPAPAPGSAPGAAAQGGATGPINAAAAERPGSNVPPAGGIPGMPGNPAGGAQPGRAPGQGTARSEAQSLLALYPFDSSVLVGETFDTEVVSDVRTGLGESVFFTLTWPAEDLNPLSLNHNALAALGVKEFDYGIDPEKGILSARIQFPRPVPLYGQSLIHITWEALRPAQAAKIRFRFDGDVPTEIKSGGENVLGTPSSPEDGILHSVILIRPRAVTTVSARTAEGGMIMGGPEALIPPASVRLSMAIDKPNLRTGDSAVVTVSMSNPERVPFDRVRLYLQYDPSRLEVLDTDRGNAMRSGTNIREPERDAFPFDFLRSNSVNTRNGWIELDAGTETRTIETTGGILAQAGFRALQAGPAQVTLVRNSDGMAPTTDIYLNGVTVMDAPRATARPMVLAGTRIAARGPNIESQQLLDSGNSASATNRSAVLFSSGLAKQRQFGTVRLQPSPETSAP